MTEQDGFFITPEEYQRLRQIEARARQERKRASDAFWLGVGLGWLGNALLVLVLVEKMA